MIITRRVTKQEARYTDAGGQEKCAYCRFFAPQGWCGKVLGPVSARGWCKYYSREMVQRSTAGAISNARPAPNIDLNFTLTPGTLPSGVVFTRASVGTYFDAAGALQTATTNAPRWTYDPVTHVLQGMLIETSRTNLLLNSASLGTQSATVTAAATTLSFYGTGTVTMSGAFVGTLVGAGAFPQRASVTFTPAAGSLTLTVTGSVLNAQLETGGFASSWIPTTGTTVARAVEHCTLTDGVALGGTVDRTLAVEAWVQQSVLLSHLGSVDDTTVTNHMRFFSPAGLASVRWSITVAGASQVNGADVTTGARPLLVKAALASGSVWNAAANGVAAVGGVSQQLGPLTTLHCGETYNGTQQLDGAIRRVSYWSRALSRSELIEWSM